MQRNLNNEGDDLRAMLNNQNADVHHLRACKRLQTLKTRVYLVEAAWFFAVLYLWLYAMGTKEVHLDWRYQSFLIEQVAQTFLFVVVQLIMSRQILDIGYGEATRRYRKYDFLRCMIYFVEIWIMFFVQKAGLLMQDLLDQDSFNPAHK